MQILNEKDYKLLEQLVSLTQNEMKYALNQYLQSKYNDKVIFTKDYIVAIGNIPIALVAHMDTVFKIPAFELYYDQRKGVLWGPNGAGFDDRAGIFAIIKILQSGLRPSVIFTTDEEVGGLGASKLALNKCPIPNLKYMIELDRRGNDDCVFYNCNCPEFIDYIENFGFYKRWGSFSDISFLMPEWQICGVNLSVGYENEHTESEILNIKPLFNTINKVKNMLQEKNIPDFSYTCSNHFYGQHCSCCKKLYLEYELVPVKGTNDKIKYYCPDCVVDNVTWCERCGIPFEKSDSTTEICKECMEEVCGTTSNDNSKK